MNQKLENLLRLKEDMSDEVFRLVAASILLKHFIDELKNRGRSMHRSKLLFRVNLSLRSLGCDEVSYGFIRSMY